jgi:iron complex transport system substrate-binding protein
MKVDWRKVDALMPVPLRIASLLPSATEICFALGLGDSLVGVSHECDFPPQARGKPVLTAPKIDAHVSSAEIDRQVNSLVSQGLSLYQIDERLLRELRPDLILTQDVCHVCAVPFSEVREATRRLLGTEADILSLSPRTLKNVFEDIGRVGSATGTEVAARGLVTSLEERLESLRVETSKLRHPRVLVLEWLDPPMAAGHWTPELIRIAGGHPILGRDAEPSRPTEWQRIRDEAPEVVLVAPCGFQVNQSLREMGELLKRPGFAQTPAAQRGQLAVVDGSSYFNRSGPRLADSAEIAALVIHPEHFGERIRVGREALVRWSQLEINDVHGPTGTQEKGDPCFQY